MRAYIIGGLIGLCFMAAAAQRAAPSQHGIYSCTDDQGRRLTADRPIAACLDREQRVFGPSGLERAPVGPTLTGSEREALEVKRRQQQQLEQRTREELRRQRALAYRYPDQAAHDAERAAAIGQIDEVVVMAQRRADELRAERRKLNTELEFYAKDLARVPGVLRRKVAQSDAALAEQERFDASQLQEIRRTHQRFDAELAQLRRLWAAAP